MTARILSIGTATPPTTITQDRIRDFFAQQPDCDRLTQRLIRATFDAAADRAPPHGAPRARRSRRRRASSSTRSGVLRSPGTALRNAEYIRLAPDLSRAGRAGGARRGRGGGIRDHARRHRLVHRMLRPRSRLPHRPRPRPGRLHRALPPRIHRLRRRLPRRCARRSGSAPRSPTPSCSSSCTELCSLHIRAEQLARPDRRRRRSSPTASAAADRHRRPRQTGPGLDLERFGTDPHERGRGGHGLDDRRRRLRDGAHRRGAAHHRARDPRCGRRASSAATVPTAWAVHPGGRSILDRVETGLELEPDALDASRAVLRDYGNMSSATMLFILRRAAARRRDRRGRDDRRPRLRARADRRVGAADQAHGRRGPASDSDRRLAVAG